ncbi:hypothetical protein HEP87_48365 [Streptomyces sp. S1D4-11]|nr:hypothetical protein [Streptomyces sp. S1D4-11]QIZ00222.1 hypothetical protein HEP87_48365 [Streptomyces sp. S1D4-11]
METKLGTQGLAEQLGAGRTVMASVSKKIRRPFPAAAGHLLRPVAAEQACPTAGGTPLWQQLLARFLPQPPGRPPMF